MQCLDPEKAEIYKFLGYEQSDVLKKAVTLGRVKQEMISRPHRVLESRLIDKYLMKAINTNILPVAACIMNMCPLSAAELKELDMIVKRMLREKSIHGWQGSNEGKFDHGAF